MKNANIMTMFKNTFKKIIQWAFIYTVFSFYYYCFAIFLYHVFIPWIFIGSTDAETETAILWPPGAKNWLIGKDPDAGKDWGQEEKGATEDEMVGWHHRLNGHEFEQAPGVGDRQGSLVCCSPWGRKESDMTEWLNWLTETQRWESEEAVSSGITR